MVLASVEKMVGLQKKASGIRNICVLAHVDHGEAGVGVSSSRGDSRVFEWWWGALVTVLKQ